MSVGRISSRSTRGQRAERRPQLHLVARQPDLGRPRRWCRWCGWSGAAARRRTGSRPAAGSDRPSRSPGSVRARRVSSFADVYARRRRTGERRTGIGRRAGGRCGAGRWWRSLPATAGSASGPSVNCPASAPGSPNSAIVASASATRRPTLADRADGPRPCPSPSGTVGSRSRTLPLLRVRASCRALAAARPHRPGAKPRQPARSVADRVPRVNDPRRRTDRSEAAANYSREQHCGKRTHHVTGVLDAAHESRHGYLPSDNS